MFFDIFIGATLSVVIHAAMLWLGMKAVSFFYGSGGAYCEYADLLKVAGATGLTAYLFSLAAANSGMDSLAVIGFFVSFAVMIYLLNKFTESGISQSIMIVVFPKLSAVGVNIVLAVGTV